MKVRSTIAPKNFKIGDRKGNLIEVAFFDDITEIHEEEETLFEYSVYKMKTIFREDLESFINDNYESWLTLAKETDYQAVAKEVREKRNKLLEESDKQLLLDRLSFNIPSEITAGTLLSVVIKLFDNLKSILNGEWAEYRQKLRDITTQEGFPYNVEFPVKPEEENKVEE